MEEIRGFSHDRVAFKSHHHMTIFEDKKLQTKRDYIRSQEAPFCCQSVTDDAMEYLSRSWSPETSNFLQIFSTNNFQLSLGNSDRQEHRDDRNAGDWEGEEEDGEIRQQRKPQQALTAIDKHTKKYQKSAASHHSWLNLNQIKGWLRGTPFTSLMRWRNDRTKEELRLRTAKVDAAVSVAQLAAAIAGITGTNCPINGAMVPRNNDIGNAVSFAAALVAAVCAEAAESAGAPKKHVASAINCGFATQTQADMETLTAAAATCLRGATTLRSRTMAGVQLQERKELIKSVTPLPVLTPSGHKRYGLVSISLQCNQLLLSLTKKFLGSVLTSREYTIVDMMGEVRKGQGYYYTISLQTNEGELQLLFQNEKQKLIWMATIKNFLHKHNSCVNRGTAITYT